MDDAAFAVWRAGEAATSPLAAVICCRMVMTVSERECSDCQLGLLGHSEVGAQRLPSCETTAKSVATLQLILVHSDVEVVKTER